MRKIKRIPRFKNEAAEARFWDKHSITEFSGEFETEVVADAMKRLEAKK